MKLTTQTSSTPAQAERMKKLLEDTYAGSKYSLRPRTPSTPILKPVIKRRKAVKPKDIFALGIMNIYYYRLKQKPREDEDWPEFPIRC